MFLKEYLKSEFNKNVLTLLTGATLAQLILILISPILSRLYKIEDFGQLATLMAVVSPIVIISSLRYELAIVLPKEDSKAINLLILALIMTLFIALLSLFGVVIFNHSIKFNLGNINSSWLYFIPILVLLIGMYQCLNNWGNRLKKYRSLSAYRIYNSTVNASTTLTFGFLKTGSIGLLMGVILGNIAGLLVLILTTWNSIKSLLHHVSFQEIKLASKEYKVFPLTNSLQATSDVFQINGVIYFMSYYFSTVMVGWYSFAIRILQAPMNLIGAAIAQVFYQQASSDFNNKICLQPLVKKTIFKSALIGAPVLLILILFGPLLFEFIFGKNWREAGVYAQILSPWIYLDFIRSPISQVPIIINKQKKLLLFSIISNTLLVLSMFYGGVIAQEIKSAFYVLTISQSIYIIFIIMWIFKNSKKDAIYN